MENKVWGMRNTRPGVSSGKFKKGTAANGVPDGFHYISNVLPTLLCFRSMPFCQMKMIPYLFSTPAFSVTCMGDIFVHLST